MTDIKLWYSPGACSLAPLVLLHEIEVPFAAIETSVAKGANLTDAFTRLNPKQRVPVLSLDGEVVTEVPAIATAISSLAPERHLMGRTTLDQVRTYEWMNWLSGTLHAQAFGAFWRPQRFVDDPDIFPALAAKARQTISECFAVIDGKLKGPWSTGDGFTAADAFLLVLHRWGTTRIAFDMAEAYPRYTRFAQGLLRRKSAAAALATEATAAWC